MCKFACVQHCGSSACKRVCLASCSSACACAVVPLSQAFRCFSYTEGLLVLDGKLSVSLGFRWVPELPLLDWELRVLWTLSCRSEQAGVLSKTFGFPVFPFCCFEARANALDLLTQNFLSFLPLERGRTSKRVVPRLHCQTPRVRCLGVLP